MAPVLLGSLAFRVVEIELHQVFTWGDFLEVVQKRFGLSKSEQRTRFYAQEKAPQETDCDFLERAENQRIIL